jgi:cytidylate kinase
MNPNLKKIITIDGPAGAGKSTLARDLARCLTWVYLDTGALYRAMALTAARRGLDPHDQTAAEDLARSINLSAEPRPNGTAIMVDDEDVTALLRSPEVTRDASIISVWPGVREALLGLQRALGDKGQVVAEGRDMGTVVFPDAGLKFFLHARPEARAQRRHQELKSADPKITRDEVLRDIEARDQADYERPVSPLKVPDDALTIDSTNLGPDEVLKVMVNAFRNSFFAKSCS